MMPLSDLIRKLGAAGCSIEQIAVAIEAQEQQIEARTRRQSEANAARQRRWREKQRNVTSQDISKRDKEQPANDALTTLLPSSSDSQEKKEGVGGRARGCRLPSDWGPTNADACFALPLIGEGRMAEEAEKFRDYWHARAGPGGVKLDWAATWRTWIRKAAADGKQHRNGQASSTMDAFDRIIAGTGGEEPGDPPMRDITPRGG